MPIANRHWSKHFLPFTGTVAMPLDLWETIAMPKTNIEVGQIVVPDGLVGVYRVVSVSPDGEIADIEKFDISKQKSVGDPVRSIAANKLTAYKEDANESAARIIREKITED